MDSAVIKRVVDQGMAWYRERNLPLREMDAFVQGYCVGFVDAVRTGDALGVYDAVLGPQKGTV